MCIRDREGAAQQYGRKLFQNGAMISGIVEVDTDLKKEGRDEIKEQFWNSFRPYCWAAPSDVYK